MVCNLSEPTQCKCVTLPMNTLLVKYHTLFPPELLLIDSVEDLLSGDREISQWAQFIDRVVDTRSTETVTHSANCREYRGVYTTSNPLTRLT